MGCPSSLASGQHLEGPSWAQVLPWGLRQREDTVGVTVQELGEESKDGSRGKKTVRQVLMDVPDRRDTLSGVQKGQEHGASKELHGQHWEHGMWGMGRAGRAW